ncbi:hypothetical protein OQA88_9364 [Cercophora sp. LCS_1]
MFSKLLCVGLLARRGLARPRLDEVPEFEDEDIASGKALAELSKLALKGAEKLYNEKCDATNVKVRKEWRTLSKPQRRQYIAAVQCLLEKPSILEPGRVPAAKNHFDDFVYAHLNQTSIVHGTVRPPSPIPRHGLPTQGNFLPWHRFFIHTYENSLTSCGYKHPLPYWEWGLDVDSPKDLPLFDGSDTSVSGDGAPVPHGDLMVQSPGEPIVWRLPPGEGGGCIHSGPFVNMTVNFRPKALSNAGTLDKVRNDEATVYEPRCIKRDLNSHLARAASTFRNTTGVILKAGELDMFQGLLEGRFTHNADDPTAGIHVSGHLTFGGDPGGDVFLSPADPAFYFHHAQIDRVFWIWQMLDFENRNKMAMTITPNNNPPSRNATLDDPLWLDPLATEVVIRDMMNTVDGDHLCYVYESHCRGFVVP